MKQGASQILLGVLLAAALLGLLVLLSVPDYREALILESNRGYMPAVRIEAAEAEPAAPAAEVRPGPAAPAAEGRPEAAAPPAGAAP